MHRVYKSYTTRDPHSGPMLGNLDFERTPGLYGFRAFGFWASGFGCVAVGHCKIMVRVPTFHTGESTQGPFACRVKGA